MSEISKHPLEGKMTQEQIDTYMKLDYHEGQAYLHELELGAGLRVRDELNPERLHEVAQPAAAAAPKFKIKVAGVEYTADTLEELNAQYEPALKAVLAANQAAKANDIPRNSNGTFAKQPGVTDGADHIVNGLVTKALQEELGITPQELQASVAQIREGTQYMNSWAAATQAFLKQNPDYRGDESTVQAVATRLQEMGLDEKPSVESLQKAYDSLSAEADRYARLQDAKSPEEIAEILGINDRRNAARTSAMWGKS